MKKHTGNTVFLNVRRRCSFLLICTMMCALFTGCGKSSDIGIEGKYVGSGMSYSGFDMDVDGDANYIELKSGGKGTICLEGTSESLKWSTDDGGATLTIKIEGDDYDASIDNGTLTLDLMGIMYIYEGENGAGAGSGGSSASGAALSGSVLDRLKGVTAGYDEYSPEDANPAISNSSYGSGSDSDWDEWAWGDDEDEDDDYDLSEDDSSSASSSGSSSKDDILAGMTFGSGIVDPQTMAEVYVWADDQDKDTKKAPSFYDTLADKMGVYPINDCDTWDWTDNADNEIVVKWISEDEGSDLTVTFDINDDGTISYRNGSISGDAMDIWADLKGYEW